MRTSKDTGKLIHELGSILLDLHDIAEQVPQELLADLDELEKSQRRLNDIIRKVDQVLEKQWRAAIIATVDEIIAEVEKTNDNPSNH